MSRKLANITILLFCSLLICACATSAKAPKGNNYYDTISKQNEKTRELLFARIDRY